MRLFALVFTLSALVAGCGQGRLDYSATLGQAALGEERLKRGGTLWPIRWMDGEARTLRETRSSAASAIYAALAGLDLSAALTVCPVINQNLA